MLSLIWNTNRRFENEQTLYEALLVKEGDENNLRKQKERNDAIEYLYRKYLNLIKKEIKWSKEEYQTDFEDLFEDAIVVLLKHINSNKFKLDREGGTKNYLIRTIRNKRIDQFRKKARAISDKIDNIDDYDRIILSNDVSEDILMHRRQIIAKIIEFFPLLPEHCADILAIIVQYGDLSNKEIVEMINLNRANTNDQRITMTESMVKNRKSICPDALAKKLQDAGFGEDKYIQQRLKKFK